jgi:hypothetical protein
MREPCGLDGRGEYVPGAGEATGTHDASALMGFPIQEPVPEFLREIFLEATLSTLLFSFTLLASKEAGVSRNATQSPCSSLLLLSTISQKIEIKHLLNGPETGIHAKSQAYFCGFMWAKFKTDGSIAATPPLFSPKLMKRLASQVG